MKKQRNSGTAGLADGLNELLAAFQVAYFNARACHWMVKGDNFFELHKLFETLYTDAADKIDEVAERVLTLGGVPLQSGAELIRRSEIPEKDVKGEESACVKLLLDDLRALGEIEKRLVDKAGGLHDVVTADQLTGYMRAQQKTMWMLSQFLSKRSAVL